MAGAGQPHSCFVSMKLTTRNIRSFRRFIKAWGMHHLRDFPNQYPDAKALARANAEEVLAMLRGLGLQWRAANIINFGREVVERFAGHVPATDAELRSLPGVGQYVSAAVRCFAFGEAVAVIDTNTVRVIGRVFGLRTEGEARRRREIRMAADKCVDPEEPRLYNLALIDFASGVCTSRAPRHEECPFSKRRRCAFHIEAVKS